MESFLQPLVAYTAEVSKETIKKKTRNEPYDGHQSRVCLMA